MAASATEPNEDGLALTRQCHLCGEQVQSSVWYARTETREDRPQRIYACPECYFDLDDERRATYYRERV